jgi:hypothetical protein
MHAKNNNCTRQNSDTPDNIDCHSPGTDEVTMTPLCRPHPRLSSLLALLVVGLLSQAACGGRHINYTKKLSLHHHLSNKEVRGMQFYLSNGLSFYRIVGADGKTISLDHTIVRRDNHTYENIEIKSGTPGVVLRVEKNILAISFEKGSYLVFTNIHVPEFGEPQKDSFNRNYFIQRVPHADKPTTMMYTCATYKKDCKQQYFLTIRDGFEDAHLVISRKELDKLKRKHHIQKGRRVE